MSRYQIGTAETGDVVGSRAASSDNLMKAKAQCRLYSSYKHVVTAWLREVDEQGHLGPPIVMYRNGREL